jgi:hypothetical protein
VKIRTFAVILQSVGLAAIAGGVALVNLAAGVITAGVGVVLIGIALELSHAG